MNGIPVYLDNNATTRPDPRVIAAILPFFSTHYGNAASSTHLFGWEAKDAVEEAREKIGNLICADPREIIFTSGATESVNLAIKGTMEQLQFRGKHLLVAETEHKAVLDTAAHLQKSGYEVTLVPVDQYGLVNAEQVESLIRPDTVMMAIMFANNETGVIQPITQIAAIARKHELVFFCDATQAAGKIPIDVNSASIDLLALSAHKMYGPKGIGALYINRKSAARKPVAQMDGGGHERGFRSGTLNVPAIVGFGEAASICSKEMYAEEERIRELRDFFEQTVLEAGDAFVNGHTKSRMYNTSNVSFMDVEPQRLMVALAKHMAISSGSACTSVVQEPSYVLKAMGLGDDRARNAFRFSLGRFTTREEISFAAGIVLKTVALFRR